MEQELSAASAFLAGYLPPPTANFTTNLKERLQERYEHHWHPLDPERGSAYRALVRSPSAQLDQSIVQAAQQSGLTRQEIERALQSADGKIWLGDRWTLWVDPGCVSLRVERGESMGRDSTQFIEIWGKLPESLRSHAVPLASIASASVNISSPAADSTSSTSTVRESTTGSAQDPNLLSPTKRSSKAIQILPPPSRSVSSSFAGVSASPIGKQQAAPTALLASPLIIPPTPLRPANSDTADVFSPTPSPSSSLNLGRSPSPLSASAKSYGGLAPSPTGFPLFPSTRRSASRGSFSSSHSQRSSSNASSDSSDGEGSASDGVFSSTESLSSSVTSAGTSKLWSGAQQSTQEAILDAEFKYPSLPVRPTSAGGNPPLSPYSFPHHRLNVPMSPSKHLSPSAASNSGSAGARSLPSSPTKPRRRGTRGGSGQGSQSYALAHGHALPSPASPNGAHEAGSSISSMSSITSAVSTSRTREQALAGTLTEHSGGKVGVLGGGVLLGLAGAKMLGNARGEVVGEAKRRGRERRRGGGQRKEGGLAPYGMQPQPMVFNGGQWGGEMMM